MFMARSHGSRLRAYRSLPESGTSGPDPDSRYPCAPVPPPSSPWPPGPSRSASPLPALLQRRPAATVTTTTPIHSPMPCTATRRTAPRRPTPRETDATPAFIGAVNADQASPGAARRRHPLGQAVLHAGLRPADRRPVDAVRRPAGLHAGRQRVDRLPQDGGGRRRVQRRDRPDRLRDATPTATWSTTRRQPGRQPRPRALDLLPAPRRTRSAAAGSTCCRRRRSYDRAHPTDAPVRRERDVGARRRPVRRRVNVPGGSNNDADLWYGAPTPRPQQTRRPPNRTGADLRWLDRAFAPAHGRPRTLGRGHRPRPTCGTSTARTPPT